MTWHQLLAIKPNGQAQGGTQEAIQPLDLGELLGIAVTHDCHAHIISLCQDPYIENIAKCLHLKDTHPATTPLDPHTVLSKDLGPTSEEEKIWMKKIPYTHMYIKDSFIPPKRLLHSLPYHLVHWH